MSWATSEFSVATVTPEVLRSIWPAGTVKRITFFNDMTFDCFYMREDSSQRDSLLGHLSDSPFYVVAFHILKGELKVVHILCPFGIAIFRIHQTANFLHQFVVDISGRDVWFMRPDSARPVLHRYGFQIPKSNVAARFADDYAEISDAVYRFGPWKNYADVPLELNDSFLTVDEVIRLVFWPLCAYQAMAPAFPDVSRKKSLYPQFNEAVWSSYWAVDPKDDEEEDDPESQSYAGCGGYSQGHRHRFFRGFGPPNWGRGYGRCRGPGMAQHMFPEEAPYPYCEGPHRGCRRWSGRHGGRPGAPEEADQESEVPRRDGHGHARFGRFHGGCMRGRRDAAPEQEGEGPGWRRPGGRRRGGEDEGNEERQRPGRGRGGRCPDGGGLVRASDACERRWPDEELDQGVAWAWRPGFRPWYWRFGGAPFHFSRFRHFRQFHPLFETEPVPNDGGGMLHCPACYRPFYVFEHAVLHLLICHFWHCIMRTYPGNEDDRVENFITQNRVELLAFIKHWERNPNLWRFLDSHSFDVSLVRPFERSAENSLFPLATPLQIEMLPQFFHPVCFTNTTLIQKSDPFLTSILECEDVYVSFFLQKKSSAKLLSVSSLVGTLVLALFDEATDGARDFLNGLRAHPILMTPEESAASGLPFQLREHPPWFFERAERFRTKLHRPPCEIEAKVLSSFKFSLQMTEIPRGVLLGYANRSFCQFYMHQFLDPRYVVIFATEFRFGIPLMLAQDGQPKEPEEMEPISIRTMIGSSLTGAILDGESDERQMTQRFWQGQGFEDAHAAADEEVRCPRCNTDFPTPQKLREHMTTMHGQEPVFEDIEI
jgi:hypothetical protein